MLPAAGVWMPPEAWVHWSPAAAAWHWVWGGTAAQAAAAPVLAVSAGAALLALAIDRCWGEPPARLHPVVWMGQLLDKVGKKIAPSQDTTSFCKSFVLGATAWIGLAALVLLVSAVLHWGLHSAHAVLQALALGLLLKPLLAWRMLRSEVLAVEGALQQSLAHGRERLSWLVSRDTSQLDAGVVRESVIETLAENLSDSVIAPLLWFALLGLPGAAVYRLANTADAMWGYPGWRGQGEGRRYWQWAGKWAARADDVLNWLPARLTAALLALVAGGVGLNGLRRDAAVTPSPNGGWPMGAMARALGVRLGKPGVYVLNPEGAVPQPQHVAQAVALASRAVGVVAVGIGAALLALAGGGYGL